MKGFITISLKKDLVELIDSHRDLLNLKMKSRDQVLRAALRKL